MAMALPSQMLDRKLSPSVITYNALINGQCKADHLDSAYRLCDLMKESGLVPDQQTYAVVIDAFFKRERLNEAYALFDSLKDEGIKSNKVIYTALIDGYCKVGKVKEAHSLFNRREALLLAEKMSNVGLKPTVVTYKILVKKTLKEADFDHAYWLLDKMILDEDLTDQMNKEGAVPDSHADTLLIDAYGCLGLIDHAFDVLSACLTLAVNGQVMKLVLKMYGQAMKLVDIMIGTGHFPSLESSRMLVCGLYDEYSSEKAKSVL
ncbi:hypothetical protein FEM48_Zijuj08G0091800 [Ziziphus jujuba var. spinosa]|uniref:Pentatricopeptide repeat-containing protein n=1 Tax=Ziziphus jujuba var. spinosa TaxID=714518 RepID=A0A978UY85_ZIZJJ|nr:hypothetical protein FEM48_Zijuj08G0091800 [Ziziphus jujuba var. spinosa]